MTAHRYGIFADRFISHFAREAQELIPRLDSSSRTKNFILGLLQSGDIQLQCRGVLYIDALSRKQNLPVLYFDTQTRSYFRRVSLGAKPKPSHRRLHRCKSRRASLAA